MTIHRCITLKEQPLKDILSHRKTMEVRSFRFPDHEILLGLHANRNVRGIVGIEPGTIVAMAQVVRVIDLSGILWVTSRDRHRVEGRPPYKRTWGWALKHIVPIMPVKSAAGWVRGDTTSTSSRPAPSTSSAAPSSPTPSTPPRAWRRRPMDEDHFAQRDRMMREVEETLRYQDRLEARAKKAEAERGLYRQALEEVTVAAYQRDCINIAEAALSDSQGGERSGIDQHAGGVRSSGGPATTSPPAPSSCPQCSSTNPAVRGRVFPRMDAPGSQPKGRLIDCPEDSFHPAPADAWGRPGDNLP